LVEVTVTLLIGCWPVNHWAN